ncbi:MAG: N-acetylmuramoyl-L-alanine amidase [Actinobacteria bacterium]|nr:N-acetylmuramoyl-L-alanine amidase [Actinomycetota bacterium]
MRIIRPGDSGEAVRDVQHRLLGLGELIDPDELEGRFGPSTEAAVRAFQQKRGLPSDGLVGPDTWSRLVEAGYGLGDRTLYLRYPSFRGDDVRALQRRLNALGFDAGREDGIHGPRTDEAVREFQRNVGGPGDGILGPETVAALGRLHRPVEGPSRAVVREAESLRRMESSLAGAAVAIDPGHGPGDPGNRGPGGTTEAEATMLLARELADELAARGAVPTLLRDADRDPTPAARAQAANELGAAVCISIHLNGGDPSAEGATCFYFGTEGTYSPAGRRLAEVIQQELTSRLGLMDGRTHALAVALLRETRMPAVQVEPCFISNPREEGMLLDRWFRRRIAEAVAVGVERFFGAVGADRPAPAVTR